jgi:nucleoid DNA-binding protein
MKELINIIVQKTGISQENAQKAVQVMLGFLKTKLPAPFAGQLDSFLSAGTSPGVNPVAFVAKA